MFSQNPQNNIGPSCWAGSREIKREMSKARPLYFHWQRCMDSCWRPPPCWHWRTWSTPSWRECCSWTSLQPPVQAAPWSGGERRDPLVNWWTSRPCRSWWRGTGYCPRPSWSPVDSCSWLDIFLSSSRIGKWITPAELKSDSTSTPLRLFFSTRTWICMNVTGT